MIDYDDLSIAFEEATGADSIVTIVTHYEVEGSRPGPGGDGVYECPFPRCSFRRRDPVAMWKHAHFGPHRRSGDPTLEQVVAVYEAGGYPT